MEHLFEEPCPLYEPEWEEDHYWDCRLTYDHDEEIQRDCSKHHGCHTRLPLYRGRDYQRFWVLEEIARAPYFAFLSVLHFRESMGLRGPEHLYLMKQHFEQSVNETEHLEYMESRGGNSYWIDRFVAKHLVLIYYWSNVVYYGLSSSPCLPSPMK